MPDRDPAPERRLRKRRSLEDIVRSLASEPEFRDRFAHWHEEPEREARTAAFPAGLDPELVALFRARGMEQLYSHQAEAIEHALAGHDVLVTTPTASGKTLAYTAPVLQKLLETGGGARSIWLFPTKALSQDQSRSLNAWIEALGRGWHSFTYDGDTPPSVRRTLRERGHVILSNPWMLHTGILPHHAKWADLFRSLEYVVIDEVHTLSGVFGSSVANVLRRLLRIARHYGANPRFLLSSATLREPESHARALIGRTPKVVTEDGSPAGKRVFGVYSPPIIDPVAGLRANALEEARRLARLACGPAHQTIIFCNRRTSVEVLTRYLKEGAKHLGLEPDEIRGYRGGYLPLLRREVEAGLKEGGVKVVVTTNALELGIDIGSLDVALLVGYPGSQASFWQRAGRAGRRGRTSLVVMIARSDPIDQFLSQHPDFLFAAPRERMGVDADNLVILSEQLKCATFELPFRAPPGEDPEGFGDSPHVAGILDYLADDSELLQRRADGWYWMADAYPAQDVSLIGNEPDNVLILDAETGAAIGEIDREGSITTCYEGAIYQVEGETWKIERFDYENRRARAKKVDSDYFTEPQTDTDLRVLRLEAHARRQRPSGPGGPGSPGGPGGAADAGSLTSAGGEDYAVWSGEVHVTTLATMFKKIRFYTRENVGAGDIVLPPEELDTEAFLLTLSEESAAELELRGGDRGAAWHGLGALLRRVAPLFLRCRPQDLGLSAHIKSPDFGRPTLALYDRVQGGVGLGRLFYAEHRSILGAALEVLDGCSCRSGCPACVGPVDEVGPLGKEVAAALLRHFLGGEAPREAPVEGALEAERAALAASATGSEEAEALALQAGADPPSG